MPCVAFKAKPNIVLIGMAGSGKSSVGRLLAAKLGRPFLDTDDLLVRDQGKPLQEILDDKGPLGFRRIEEAVLVGVNVRNHVIATGGSSIYSSQGMAHLKKSGLIILLRAELDILKERVGDGAERGLVKQPGQSFEDLYAERRPLYEKSAEITVDCAFLDQEQVCGRIVADLKKKGMG